MITQQATFYCSIDTYCTNNTTTSTLRTTAHKQQPIILVPGLTLFDFLDFLLDFRLAEARIASSSSRSSRSCSASAAWMLRCRSVGTEAKRQRRDRVMSDGVSECYSFTADRMEKSTVNDSMHTKQLDKVHCLMLSQCCTSK